MLLRVVFGKTWFSQAIFESKTAIRRRERVESDAEAWRHGTDWEMIVRPTFTQWNGCTVQTRVLALLDLLCRLTEPKCIVDLGSRGQGRGRINGGYLRYLLGSPGRRGIAVDLDGDGMESSKEFDFVLGDFNSPEIIERVQQIGPPDVALAFNVLLHQLDWKQTLRRWSHVPCLCIFGPRWNEPKSVRLLDRGREWFHDHLLLPLKQQANYEGAVKILNGPNPYERLELWQWGVSEADLLACLNENGYRCLAAVDFGPHEAIDGFDWQGHVLCKIAADGRPG